LIMLLGIGILEIASLPNKYKEQLKVLGIKVGELEGNIKELEEEKREREGEVERWREETMNLREEVSELREEVIELREEVSELREEVSKLREEVLRLQEEVAKYVEIFSILKEEVRKSGEELEEVEREREELKKKVEENKEDVSLLDALGVTNERFHQIKELIGFLSVIPSKTRIRIGDLERGKNKETLTARMNVLQCASKIFGDNLEDVARCLSVLYNFSVQPDPGELEASLDLHFNKEETWDICLRCDLSDEQLESLRNVLKEKRSCLRRLFACPRSVGTVRRKLTKQISKLLLVQRTPNGLGVFTNTETVMKFIISNYGSDVNWTSKEKCQYKLSGDGKVNESKTQWMMGISPLSLPNICLQSPYNVFPLALVCCDEKNEVLKQELDVLFAELKKLNEKGEIEDEKGRKHFFVFILVTDLKTCWQVYGFGGHSAHHNCPYCDVHTPKDRACMDECWPSWSRDSMTSLLGIGNDRFVFCTLHLLLRCIEFFLQDVYNKVVKLKEEKKLAYLMTVVIGVGWSVYEGSKGKKGTRVRSFNGTQCKKILKKIELIAELIEVENMKGRDLGKKVWGGFKEMLEVVEDGRIESQKCQEGKCGECADCVVKKNMRWGKLFKALHGGDTLRLYFHILIFHAADCVVRFGPLRPLSQQGFERSNCEMNYFARRHSSHTYGLLKRKGREVELQTDTLLQVVTRSYMVHTIEGVEKPALTKKKHSASRTYN
jgi:hypothetical protein